MLSSRKSSSGKKSSGTTISISFTEADFTCPISEEVFFEPEVAMPCGHYFEKEEINKWLKNNKNCPCCRTDIEKTYDAPPSFQNLLQNALNQNPELQQQRYFSLDILSRMLKLQDKHKLDRIINYLVITDNHINEIDDQGSSVVFKLVNAGLGLEMLAKCADLRAKINNISLNTSVTNAESLGETPVAYLAWDGIELLKNDDLLRSKITPYGLNNVITGLIDKGTSALYWLCKNKAGAELLCRDMNLRAKITEEGLNSVQTAKKEHVDLDSGTSAVFFLVKSPEGLELLLNDDTMRSKINAKGIKFSVLRQRVYGSIRSIHTRTNFSGTTFIMQRWAIEKLDRCGNT